MRRDGQVFEEVDKVDRREPYQKVKMRFTERDAEIVKMILDMKFATGVDVYQLFFKGNSTSDLDVSLSAVNARLAILEKCGLIRKVDQIFTAKKFCVGTSKGQKAVEVHYPHAHVTSPIHKIDIRTLLHDWQLLKARTHLESTGAVKLWFSERHISENPLWKPVLPKNLLPDAVVVTHQNRKVALELEIAQKGLSKYREKIEANLRLMRGKKREDLVYEKVIFICEKERVYEILKHETRLYVNYFSVVRSEEVFRGDEYLLDHFMNRSAPLEGSNA